MATRVTIASGNFTAAGTWGVVDTTSLLDSETGSTALTNAYVSSSSFNPGAITIDRICVKLASRAAGSPSNTITVALDQGGSDVAGTVVTINVSDLDACSASGTSPAVATNEGGWYAFKFAAPVTLLGATAYSVKAKLSATTTAVNLFRDGTAGNWSRLLVTTTTGAPAASDILHVVGEHIDTSTLNAFTLTMDNTASTTFGAVANTLGAFTVGKRGTVTWGTAASTNYLLTIAGPLILFSGSTWNMGTSGTPMPSTSTGKLLFSISSNVDGGLIRRNGSVSNCYGNVITAKTTLMTADKAIAATVIAVASTSGWAAGDELAFPPTSRTSTEYEKKTILTVDSGTQVTLTAGLTNARSGTSPTACTVAHLTRNVKICGTSTSLQAYVLNGLTAVVNDSYVEFYNLGSSTSNKRGIDVLATTGSYAAIGCTTRDNVVSSSSGWRISGSASNNISITYCNAYACQSNEFDVSAATSGTTITLDNCCAIGSSGSSGFNIADAGITLTNCLAAGCNSYGFSIGESGALITGTWSNWTSHTNGSGGVNIALQLWGGTISNLTAWRNGGAGITESNGFANLTFATGVLFGNSSGNIILLGQVDGLTINAFTCSGDSTFATTDGLRFQVSGCKVTIQSSDFGTVTGIKTAHTRDINMGPTSNWCSIRNSLLASSLEVDVTSALPNAVVTSEKHDQTAGLHKRWERYGTAIIDTTTYRTASPSEKLTPNNASVKFTSSPKQFAIANGATATVTVYVNKSSENLFTYSTDFSNGAWTLANLTRSGSQSDPLGGTLAHAFYETSASSAHHYERRTVGTSVVNGSTYTWSFYAKDIGGRNWIRVQDDNGNNKNTWFNISAGTIGTTNAAHTPTITSVGSGWYRVSITFPAGATNITPCVWTAPSNGDVNAFNGDVTKGMLLFGWQLALGSGVIGYVTTTATANVGYNGAQPRLIVRANAALGITADTVLATASGGTGSWLTLSGTTATVNDDGVLEVYVDCDGTAGTCSVDDWSVSGASDPAGGEKYWYDGRPAILLGPPVAGGSPTTIVPSFGGRVARRA